MATLSHRDDIVIPSYPTPTVMNASVLLLIVQHFRSVLCKIVNSKSPFYGFARLIHADAASYAHYAVQEVPPNFVPYDRPAYPGATRPHGPQAGPQWDELMAHWKLDHTVYNKLKQALIETFGVYVQVLQDADTGYDNVTVEHMLTHIRTRYGAPNLSSLQADEAKMKSPYDPTSMRIEELFTRLKTCQAFQGVHNPYTDTNIILVGLGLLKATGKEALLKGVKDFMARPANEQTWANFTTDFTAAYNAFLESSESNPTTQDTGHVNAATSANQPVIASGSCSFQFPNGTCMKYCWTHGLSFYSNAHSSADCPRPNPGHDTTAWFGDMKGGCRDTMSPNSKTNMVKRNRNRTNTSAQE